MTNVKMSDSERQYVAHAKEALVFDEETCRYGVLGMKYDERIIDFFKRHNLYEEEMFDYIQKNTWGICYADKPKARRVGCYNIGDKRLLDFLVVIPDQTTDFTMFIQVHEIAHAIYAYKHLGKRFSAPSSELLAFVMEKKYAEEIKSESVTKYSEHLDSVIDENDALEYRFALHARKEFMDSFNGDMKTFDKQSGKLLRKFQRNRLNN